MTRDLINVPANDMGPEALQATCGKLAERHGATIQTIAGDDLLAQNFPMIHAVGRAGSQAPRLMDMRWGAEDAPTVTLVGVIIFLQGTRCEISSPFFPGIRVGR